MTKLPNIISCSRIVFSIMLLLAADKPVLFMVLYCVCGISDIADGYLARAYNAETKLGSKLDSLGDLVFYTVWVYIFFHYINSENLEVTISGMAGVALIRAVNLLLTKAKFGQWSMVHTIGNKLAGFILFVSMPLYVLLGNTPLWSLVAVGFISAVSALEETAVLLVHSIYDADRRSVH